jgi:CRISPR-associated helicase Cas3
VVQHWKFTPKVKTFGKTTHFNRIEQSDIILTNPDILHYLHRHAYITPKDAPDKLWSPLDVKFNLFIHDEFHVFSAPQIASVINTMLLMRHTKNEHKHLFLSATPEKQLIERLKTVFAPEEIREINPYEREKYRFPIQKRKNSNWSRRDGNNRSTDNFKFYSYRFYFRSVGNVAIGKLAVNS